jgi:outer membrane protein assembly factor BamB
MANQVANITTPVVRGDLVFCSTAYKGGSALIRLVRVDHTLKAEEVYFLPPKTFQNHHGGVVLLGDYLYGADGQNDGKLTCIEFKTGKVVWHQNRGFGKRSAAVAYADGQLYVRYEDGLMVLVAATPKGITLNGKFNLPENSGKPSWPHPVIANGKLYIRDQGVLLCYDVKKHDVDHR